MATGFAYTYRSSVGVRSRRKATVAWPAVLEGTVPIETSSGTTEPSGLTSFVSCQ